MTTLAAGSSAAVALPIGYAIYASGAYGTMQVAPPNPSALIPITPAGATVGPFAIAVTVNLTASGAGITYNVDKDSVQPDFATLATDPLTGMATAVYGAGGLVTGTKNSIALLGDSITLRNYPTVTTTALYGSDGYFVQANVQMGWPFEIVGSFGYSGMGTDVILSNVASVIATSPRFCFVLAGTNDLNSLTVAQTIANLSAIYTQLRAAGITVITATIPPRNDGTTQATKRKDIQRNRWIREYSRINDVICCDFYRALVNPLSAGTAGWSLVADGNGALNDTSSDQIHPTDYGAFVMSQEIIRRLQYKLNTQTRGGEPRFSDCMYLSGIGAIAEGNIIPNGSMSGTAGVIGGTATGSLADEWSTQSATVPATGGTIVLSKVAKSDSFGYWQQIAMSGGTAGDNQGIYQMRSDQDYVSAFSQIGIGGAWQVGDSVFGQCSFETDLAGWANGGDTNCSMALSIQFFGSSGVTNANCFSNAAGQSKARLASGVLRTPTYVIPTGTTRIYLWIYVRGRGVWRFGDAEVRKVITV